MIASSAIHQLKSHFHGELIVPSDQRYDAARTIFNVTIDRRPALIAMCAGSDDVIEALNFARQENLIVSVRGSGHNVAGFAVCDDGLVIDLSGMKGITVNARAHRSRGGRVQLGRGERRAPASRPCRHRRLCLNHRRVGPHPRRRPRLARAQTWSRTRQLALRRSGACGWPPRDRQRARE